ncbi:MAG: hypothetical protein HY681_15390 [Chloroflexi bacterium]|nr:hypothetical protein [Chloroflexota bacterium]
MNRKRVVLVSNRSVLAAGIQHLLEDMSGLEVSVVPADAADLQGRLQGLAPQAIVLDGEDAATSAVITQMLEQQPGARVIVLGVQHSNIEVYSLKRVLHTDVAALLEAIQGKVSHRRE